jgi:hypothetical protein
MIQALSEEYAMSRFMALYMDLRRDRLVEEFQGRVDGHDRRCTRLCASLESTHPFTVHRHSDVWHVGKDGILARDLLLIRRCR